MTKKMSARALDGLKASIMAWKKKAAAETPDEVLISPGECPLCRLYHRNGCIGCPVEARTSRCFCDGTPLIRASFSLSAWSDDPSNADLRNKWREAANAEIAFLESLLPETV